MMLAIGRCCRRRRCCESRKVLLPIAHVPTFTRQRSSLPRSLAKTPIYHKNQPPIPKIKEVSSCNEIGQSYLYKSNWVESSTHQHHRYSGPCNSVY
jgi:hypothetical protein